MNNSFVVKKGGMKGEQPRTRNNNIHVEIQSGH